KVKNGPKKPLVFRHGTTLVQISRLRPLPEQPLSAVQLKRLEEHKYSAAGRSLFEPPCQIYWNWLVQQIPTWVAPNTLTIIGLLINILTTVILVYYSPTATEEAPGWAFFLSALGLFIYQSLDAIDGKQARRTNSSSALGELFDHGCDASFSPAPSQHPCSQTATLIIKTLISHSFTQVPVLGVNLQTFPILGIIGGFLYSTYNYFYVILNGGVGKNGSTVADTSVLSPGLHIGLILSLAFIIFKKSSSQVFEHHPCLYILTFGMVIAKISNKLVVAHMTKSELHLPDTAFIGPGLLFLNQYFNSYIDEHIVLWIAMVLSLVDLLRYCTGLCLQIASHLRIRVFSITPQGHTHRD
uniref:Cholinephosphotransferase 1 n=1 Tax=Cyprinus carpio TaxID=7962 RepID=A0A8C2ANF8_CYPCA